MKFIYLNLFSVVSAVLFSFNSVAEDFSLKNQSQAKTLHSNALNNKSSNPWHITNLYSKEDDSFFIPYHLWSGSSWDGNKNTENCMHDVRNKWVFKRGDKERKHRVSAPVDYKMPDVYKIISTFQVRK